MCAVGERKEIIFMHQDFPEIRAANLGVLVTQDPEYVEAAQRLRYRIFFDEMGGKAHNPEVIEQQRDFDAYDEVCDHLLVLDHDRPEGGQQVVGTYRLLRRAAMEKIGRFYTENEFDITAIKQYPAEVMELGRSCVDVEYRNRAVMQLLWRGIGEYVERHNVELMFGCASFNGTDIEQYKLALSYLYHNHLAPKELRPVTLPEYFNSIDLIPAHEIDAKKALTTLPALIKGYLRLNGFIGDGAFIDPECNSIDVSIVVKTDRVADKYARRYQNKSE